MTEAEVIEQTKEEKRKQAELELLLDEEKEDQGEGVAGTVDPRFSKVKKDALFAIDPTHKEFRKVTQGHNKVAKKNKRK